MELTGPDTIALTKAELLALTKFAGPASGPDEYRLVRFTASAHLLYVRTTDGCRALEVVWPIPVETPFTACELDIDAGFLALSAGNVKRADAQRVELDLRQLKASENGTALPRARLIDVENTRSGKPHEDGVWHQRDAVGSQLKFQFDGSAKYLLPPEEAEGVERSLALQTKFLIDLPKVSAACRGAVPRFYMPRKPTEPALLVYRDALSGATWTVVIAPSKESSEEIPEDEEAEAPAAETRQTTLAGPETGLEEVTDPRAARRTRKPLKGSQAQA